MKILIMSYAFPPSLGGIELFSSLMRAAFAERGHEVRVVAEVRAEMPEDGDHRVLRCPDRRTLRQAIAWADVCFVSGVSLLYQLPVMLAGKPLVIVHHGALHDAKGKVDLLYRLKRLACRWGLNITVSYALAQEMPMPALTIQNPVHTAIEPGAAFAHRPRDVAFVGRLVSEKGASVLLDALAHLRERGRRVSATIVGDGPERGSLEQRARDAGIGDLIQFTGRLEPGRIHPLLLEHKILVVPSLGKEGFPMVILEGLAAGCVVLASRTAIMTESTGPGGLTFPLGDSAALAGLIEKLLADPALAAPFRAAIPAHLEGMSLDRVADRYLEVCLLLYEHWAKLGRRKAIRTTVEELFQRA